jgi:hypothetical protein
MSPRCNRSFEPFVHATSTINRRPGRRCLF